MRIRTTEYWELTISIFPIRMCQDELECWEYAEKEVHTSRRVLLLCPAHADKFEKRLIELKGTGQGNGSMGATI